MTDVFLIVFLWLVVAYADFHLTKSNMGTTFNGIGSVPIVLSGQSQAPMQYRVLVAWMCAGLARFFGCGEHKLPYLSIYIRLRWLSILFALAASFYYFGLIGVEQRLCISLLALFFILASMYDYTDVYIEVGLFALAFSLLVHPVQPLYLWLALITLAATLNRETAVFIPITAAFMHDLPLAGWLFAMFWLGYILPRIIYGDKKRYCGLWMVGRNIRTILAAYRSDTPIVYNEYTFFFFVLVCAAGAYAFASYPLTAIEMAMGLMFAALLIPTMWREIRVFAPTMLGIIPMVVQ